MVATLSFIALLVTAVGLAYFGFSSIVWTSVFGIVLFTITAFGKLNYLFLAFCWILYIGLVLFICLKKFRQEYFTKPLVQLLEKKMPPISNTEREAIEAGNVWWEKDLFCGKPNWKKLHAIPQPTLTEDEQSFLDDQVNILCNMLDDWEIVNNLHNLPDSVWEYLKKEGFFGLVIPKEYGGRGFSALAHSSIVVKIASRSISTAVNTMVPNSLGPGELLVHYGTSEQKNFYLPRLAKGKDIPCFALTGPEAGSDAGSITDSGIVCYGEYEGKEVLGIRLTWDKRYITLAPIATVLGIAFRLYDPEKLIGDKTNLGITLCLIPTSHPGVEIGYRHYPLKLAFMNGPTRGKNVFIPIDWIIGGVSMAGQGWRMLMECLSIGRSISLPALSAACGKVAYRVSGAYSSLRTQFNTPIANFEGVEEALGNIAGSTYLMEACRIFTAGAVDLKIKPAIASAIAKYHLTELSRETINNAMDVHAGHAIQVGPRNRLGMLHLSTPISITVEGANILTRNLIIFGQGAIRCHPYVLSEIALFTANDNNKIPKLDRLLLSHMGYMINNFVRTWVSGLTGGKLILAPVSGAIATYYKQLTRMSSALALLSDVSMMLLGGTLKRKERLSARLGDILSQLYLASTVLKYFQDHKAPESDLNYVKWSIETCLYKIQVACNELLNNFPKKWLGKILYWVIFPFGAAYSKPKDELYRHIVKEMVIPSAVRDRLTQYCFVDESESSEDPIRRLDVALRELIEIGPLWKKFHALIRNGILPRYTNLEDQIQMAHLSGDLTSDEVTTLKKFIALQKEVIKVNEFTFDLNSVVS